MFSPISTSPEHHVVVEEPRVPPPSSLIRRTTTPNEKQHQTAPERTYEAIPLSFPSSSRPPSPTHEHCQGLCRLFGKKSCKKCVDHSSFNKLVRFSYSLAMDKENYVDFCLCVTLLLGVVMIACLTVNQQQQLYSLALNAAITLAEAALIAFIVEKGHQILSRCHLIGKDLNKKGEMDEKPNIPESLGVFVILVYVGVLLVLCGLSSIAWPVLGLQSVTMDVMCCLFTIAGMGMFGFVDDLVDLPWRSKMIAPMFAAIPVLLAYMQHASSTTTFKTPAVIHRVSSLISINTHGYQLIYGGACYYLYKVALTVFSSNAINIHAGINGLEAGQSVVVAVTVLVHNILQLNGDHADLHLMSAILMIHFIGASLGLLRWNWFPSHVFVGDSYCLFAGATFAAAAIVGHFSRSLLLFLIPQIINFLASVPQIFAWGGKLDPKTSKCPRHRLPKYNPETGNLMDDGHWNLVNLMLRVMGTKNKNGVGELHERTLCRYLLIFQVLCSCFGLFIRYFIFNDMPDHVVQY